MSLKHYFQYFSIFIFTAFFTLNLTAQTGIQNLEFKVFGNCGMCEERIEKAAMQVPGVKLPNGNTAAFGTTEYKTTAFDSSKPYLFLEIDAVFGGIEVRE